MIAALLAVLVEQAVLPILVLTMTPIPVHTKLLLTHMIQHQVLILRVALQHLLVIPAPGAIVVELTQATVQLTQVVVILVGPIPAAILAAVGIAVEGVLLLARHQEAAGEAVHQQEPSYTTY